jgi:N-acyl-D-amino-acid deacylase
MVVSSVASVDGQRWLGKSIAEIAEQRGCDAAEAIIDLLFEERLSVSVVSHNQSEVLVQSFMELDFGMFCTDGILGEQPHPRLFGSAARMLGHYVRDRQVMTLEQAVRRMSAMAYDKLGIPGEGCIAVGRGAHLVCFDPAVVLDGGSYDDPVRDPSGIRHVVVGGVLTMVDGELTGQRGGRVLRGR